MTKYAERVLAILEKRSHHLFIYGESDSGKTCWNLSLLEACFDRSQYRYGFTASVLWYLLDPNVKGILISEVGDVFDARSFSKSVAKIFEWTRIYRKLILLDTTHKDLADVIIRERTSFNFVQMYLAIPRKAIVERVGVVKAPELGSGIIAEFQEREISEKVALTRNLLESKDVPQPADLVIGY